MTGEQKRGLEHEAIRAVRLLVAAGFLAVPIGDPNDLHMLLFIRDRLDIRDAVKMYGPRECEAVRIVRRQIMKEVTGSVPEVVDAVINWSWLITATGRDYR